jgi:hypothetical protein
MGACHVEVGPLGAVLLCISHLPNLHLLSSRLVLAVRH